jgi:hypothetical protein
MNRIFSFVQEGFSRQAWTSLPVLGNARQDHVCAKKSRVCVEKEPRAAWSFAGNDNEGAGKGLVPHVSTVMCVEE